MIIFVAIMLVLYGLSEVLVYWAKKKEDEKMYRWKNKS